MGTLDRYEIEVKCGQGHFHCGELSLLRAKNAQSLRVVHLLRVHSTDLDHSCDPLACGACSSVPSTHRTLCSLKSAASISLRESCDVRPARMNRGLEVTTNSRHGRIKNSTRTLRWAKAYHSSSHKLERGSRDCLTIWTQAQQTY